MTGPVGSPNLIKCVPKSGGLRPGPHPSPHFWAVRPQGGYHSVSEGAAPSSECQPRCHRPRKGCSQPLVRGEVLGGPHTHLIPPGARREPQHRFLGHEFAFFIPGAIGDTLGHCSAV